MSDDDDNSVDDEIVPYPGKKRKSEILKIWKKKIEKGDNKEFGKERKDENTLKSEEIGQYEPPIDNDIDINNNLNEENNNNNNIEENKEKEKIKVKRNLIKDIKKMELDY